MALTEAATLAGAAVLTGILVEVLKRALAWGAAQVDRFGPLVAVVVGVLVTVLVSLARPIPAGLDVAEAIASAVITGILAGAAASGLYDLGGDQVAVAVFGAKAGDRTDPGPTGPGATPQPPNVD